MCVFLWFLLFFFFMDIKEMKLDQTGSELVFFMEIENSVVLHTFLLYKCYLINRIFVSIDIIDCIYILE